VSSPADLPTNGADRAAVAVTPRAAATGAPAEPAAERPLAVRLEHLAKTYPGNPVPAVQDLSVDIAEGEVLTLLGPSGCGKTTTLRMVAGLETPDEGSIYFGSTPIVVTSQRLFMPTEKREIGMVFQSYAIWPHMTVEENVGFPLKVRHRPAAEIRERVVQVLDLVGMAGMEKRPSPNLSGGQQQRVALARALVTNPRLLLLDEPFSNLDAKLREQMRVELRLLQKRLNIAVLFVTHDQTEALNLSDRVVLMNEGRVEQEGPPRGLYYAPASPFARDFIGKVALFRGRIARAAEADGLAVAVEGTAEPVRLPPGVARGDWRDGQPVYVAVRPESVDVRPLSAAPRPGSLHGTVEAALFSGDRMEYQIRIDGQDTILAYGASPEPLHEGDGVAVAFRPDHVTLWPRD
jgi:ABC-type Fe3+/spermidine/putrescine transport system ATPase subunit